MRALLAITALVLVSCTRPNFEEDCTPDFNFKPDDSCPYGPPGGPQVKETPCVLKMNSGGTCPPWSTIYNGVFVPKDHGNCSSAGCHGDEKTAGFGLYLPSNDSHQAFLNMQNYTGTVGSPYINKDDVAKSWILCNLTSAPGGGLPMPKPNGFRDQNDVTLVTQWAECGLKEQ